MEQITQFVKPELMILVPVLMFIGTAIKKTAFVRAKFIPVILGLCGILMSTVYVLSSYSLVGVKEILTAVFTAVTQGILAAGVSVYFHQIVKQRNEDK